MQFEYPYTVLIMFQNFYNFLTSPCCEHLNQNKSIAVWKIAMNCNKEKSKSFHEKERAN